MELSDLLNKDCSWQIQEHWGNVMIAQCKRSKHDEQG